MEVFEMAADGEMIQVKVARGNLNFCGKQVKIDYDRFNQIVQGKDRDDKISYKWLIKEMNKKIEPVVSNVPVEEEKK